MLSQNVPVAFLDHEGRHIKDVAALHHIEKRGIDQAIRNAVHENVGPGHDCRLCRIEFRRVHRYTNTVGLRLCDSCRNNLSLFLKIVVRRTDEPDLDQIRFVLELLPHELTCVVRRHGLDDIGILGVCFRRRVGCD